MRMRIHRMLTSLFVPVLLLSPIAAIGQEKDPLIPSMDAVTGKMIYPPAHLQDRAAQIVASRYKMPIGKLSVSGGLILNFEELNKTIYVFAVTHANDPRVWQMAFDTQEKEVDRDALEAQNRKLRKERYGCIVPRLYRRLQKEIASEQLVTILVTLKIVEYPVPPSQFDNSSEYEKARMQHDHQQYALAQKRVIQRIEKLGYPVAPNQGWYTVEAQMRPKDVLSMKDWEHIEMVESVYSSPASKLN